MNNIVNRMEKKEINKKNNEIHSAGASRRYFELSLFSFSNNCKRIAREKDKKM